MPDTCPLDNADKEHWCRHKPYAELKEELARQRPELGVTDTDVLACCDAICPNPSAADFHQKCTDHPYHLEYTEWQDVRVRVRVRVRAS